MHPIADPKPRGHSCFFAPHASANLGQGEIYLLSNPDLPTVLSPGLSHYHVWPTLVIAELASFLLFVPPIFHMAGLCQRPFHPSP